MTLVIKKIKTLLFIMPAVLILLGGLFFIFPQQSSAQPAGCPGGPAGPLAPGTVCPEASSGEQPYYIRNDCQETNSLNENNCGIVKYLVLIINLLSGVVGIVVAASIIVGGIQYSAAGGDPQKVSAAKNRIRNAIIALVFFIFGYALLNYLVPGGVLP